MKNPKSHRSAVRLKVELLEARDVPSAVGTLDPKFNGTGHREYALLGQKDAQAATAVAVQADGKIVAVGVFAFGNAHANAMAIRLNPDGSLDRTFGNDGRAVIDATGGIEQVANSVAIQSDGKILLGGYANYNDGVGAGNDKDFLAIRLNSDGTVDTTFDGNGVALINFGGGGTNDDIAYGIATYFVGGVRKIVLVGSTQNTPVPGTIAATDRIGIVQLNNDGSLDTSFNSTGKQFVYLVNTDIAKAVTIDSNNRIVIVGATGSGTSYDFFALRLTSTGTTDSTFGSGGVKLIDINGNDQATALAITPGGSILVGGSSSIGNLADFTVVKLTSSGTLDTSFSGNGIATKTLGAEDIATSILVRPDGRILVGGYTNNQASGSNRQDYALAQFTSAGASALLTATSSTAVYDFKGDDELKGMALDRKGNIVLAGFSNGTGGPVVQNTNISIARVAGNPQTFTAGVFDSSSATWSLRNSNTSGGPDISSFVYGAVGSQGIVGDWDGNGTFTPGWFDKSTATFHLRNFNSSGLDSITSFAFGPVGGIPVAGDWNADGIWSIGVFDPATGNWFLKNSNTGGEPDAGSFPFGGANWKPVVGDWDGNGTTTIGVVDPSGKWYLKNKNIAGSPDIGPFAYGGAGWKPVAGDWNNDGISTPGVFDPNGVWYLRNTNNSGGTDVTPFTYGLGSYTPVTGDWNYPADPLQVAGGQKRENPVTVTLTQAEAQVALSFVLNRLAGSGFNVSALRAPGAVQISIAQLGDGVLGLADRHARRITLDDNAAGYGWYTDVTDSAFTPTARGGRAKPGSLAANRIDLVSVIAHEVGHLIGLNDSKFLDDLMGETLAVGVRRLPPKRR